MATILPKKYTSKDSLDEIVNAILIIASDKNSRLLLVDEDEWKATKLKEIHRLIKLVKKKLKSVQ